MKTIVHILMLWSILFSATSFAQTFFQKAYNTNVPITADGYTYPTSITKANNNTLIIAGGATYQPSPPKAFIFCVDSLGTISWSKTYGGSASINEEFSVVKYTSDGNIVAAGRTSSGPGGLDDCYIVKIDTDGNVTWAKAFGSNADEGILDIAEDAQGNIYCCVATSKGGATAGYIVKLDGSGNLIWQKKYSSAVTDSFTSLIVLPSGHLMVSGISFDGGFHGLLLKLDSSGIISWSKIYNNSQYLSRFVKIIALPNNDFAISGFTDEPPGNLVGYQSVFKTDSAGNMIWGKRSSLTQSKGTVFLSPDNYLYLVGHRSLLYPQSQANLSKFNLSGVHLWEKEFGACDEDGFGAMAFGSSTLYLAGLTRSYGIDVSAYLVRTDTSGYTSCYDEFITPNYQAIHFTAAAYTFTISASNFTYSSHATTVNSIALYDSLICTSANPVATRFHAGDTIICAGSCISFFNDSTRMHQGYNNFVWNPLGSWLTNSNDYVPVGLKFQWLFPSATFVAGTDTLENPTNVCYANPGKYDVSLIVTKDGGCITDTLKKVNYITVISSPPAISITGNTTIFAGDSTTLSAGGTTDFVWFPSTGLSASTGSSVIANPTVTTTYTVTGNCDGVQLVTVTVEIICGEIFVPSAFSPNNDGVNDVLYTKTNCVDQLDFKIYDRWGNKVFESVDITNGWDGTYQGQPMESAVFVYYIKATLINGASANKKGNISLIR